MANRPLSGIPPDSLIFALILGRGDPEDGYVGFGALAAYGLYLVYKGWINDTSDWLGNEFAPRWLYIAFGLLLQLPFIAYFLFAQHSLYGRFW